MQITPQQLERARKKESSFAKRTKERNIILNRIYIVCGIIFIAGIVLIFYLPVVGIILAVLSALVFGGIFVMQKNADKNNMLLCYHYLSTHELNNIINMYNEEFYSPNVINKANEMLISEKDSRRCAILRNIIATASFAAGDFDGGYRALFKDDELFETDRYFALIYYSGVMEYYLSINSTTGGTEYAEQAYRSFCNIFLRSKKLKNNYAALYQAVRCEIIYSFAHGDRNKCIEYVDMLTARKSRRKLKKSDASLLLIKGECLKFMGKSKEAAEIGISISPLVAGSAYLSDRVKRLV